MSLISQSDQRIGDSFSNAMLRRKAEQAATNEAIAIQANAGATPARKAFAAVILDTPHVAVSKIMPHIVQKSQIASGGGEANDTIIDNEVKAAIAIIAP